MNKAILKKQMEDHDEAVSLLDHQSTGEEIANGITHGIGLLLSVAALVLLLAFAYDQKDAWRFTSFSIYGASLMFLYLTSTLYHSLNRRSVKRFLRKLDHAAIFLLIAGTYTPVTLILMRSSWVGWTLFGTIWFLTIGGIVFKFLFFGRFRVLSVLFYIGMGWSALFAFKPLSAVAPRGLILWLVIGGVCYTFSALFYAWRKLRYHHTIFHFLVLAGSFSHFFGLFHYLT